MMLEAMAGVGTKIIVFVGNEPVNTGRRGRGAGENVYFFKRPATSSSGRRVATTMSIFDATYMR